MTGNPAVTIQFLTTRRLSGTGGSGEVVVARCGLILELGR